MTITAFPLQLAGLTFGQEPMYRLLDHLVGAGVASGLGVVQNPAGADMSVTVQEGAAYVAVTNGGKRQFINSGNSNSGIPGVPNTADWLATFTAAHSTLPRIDRIVATIQDSLVDGGSGQYRGRFQVVAGTATSGATLANLSGAPAVPANSVHVRYVLVPAGATAITNAEISAAPAPATIGGVMLAPAAVADHCLVKGGDGFQITATATAMPFPTEASDTLGMHDNVTNNTRVTPVRTGLYLVNITHLTQSGATSRVVLRRNGSVVDIEQAAAEFTQVGSTFRYTASFTARIDSVGQYFELFWNTVGGSVGLQTGAPSTSFGVTRLAA